MKVSFGDKSIECEQARDFLSRLRGLMFRSSPVSILFEFPYASRERNSIHSFFVFFPFDAIFLDEGKKAVDIRESVPPFTPLIRPAFPPKYLIELPSGSVEKMKIKKGTKFEF